MDLDYGAFCNAHYTGSDFRSANLDGWHSVATSSLVPFRSIELSTKTLKFPSPFPEFSLEYFHMERHKPHSRQPQSKSNFSVWGTREPGSTSWTCLCVSADQDMAEVYQSRLRQLLSHADADARQKLTSHWVEPVQYMYRLGLTNACLTIRDGMKTLHKLVCKTSNYLHCRRQVFTYNI